MDKGIKLQTTLKELIEKYGYDYHAVMDMSMEKLMGVLENERRINHLKSLNDDAADEQEQIKPLSKEARTLDLLTQASQLLQEANKLTDEEDDYINIRIPNKGDVPIVTIEGRTFDSVSDEGLQSLKFVWVNSLDKRIDIPFFELKYIDQRIDPTIRTQAIGDEYVVEKLRERVNE